MLAESCSSQGRERETYSKTLLGGLAPYPRTSLTCMWCNPTTAEMIPHWPSITKRESRAPLAKGRGVSRLAMVQSPPTRCELSHTHRTLDGSVADIERGASSFIERDILPSSSDESELVRSFETNLHAGMNPGGKGITRHSVSSEPPVWPTFVSPPCRRLSGCSVAG